MQQHPDTGAEAADARRLDLDWVRIGAFALLILYHVGMFYVPWEWHVKSPYPQDWLEPVMVLTHPWRLPLLFLVSGAATRFMADRIKPGRLAAVRTARLLPPLLVGMLIVVPPQTLLQIAEAAHASPQPYGAFWIRYVTASGHWSWHGAALITPTWNHLWFVAYLLVYTLLLLAVLAAVPKLVGAIQRGGERLLSGAGLLVWPMLLLISIRSFLAPAFPETHALVGDWTVHAESLSCFLFGFLFAKTDILANGMARCCWIALSTALLSYAAYAAVLIAWPGDAVPPFDVRPYVRIVYGIDQWSWIVAIIGFAHVHLSGRDGPVRRYLTEAIFPFYIVHQTIIVVAAHYLASVGLPLAVEAGLIIVLTIAGCIATFEFVKRVGWLRPLFGLRPAPGARAIRLRQACAI